jgi:hypothetical protein
MQQVNATSQSGENTLPLTWKYCESTDVVNRFGRQQEEIKKAR